jgi:hypothetical protein
MKLDLRVRSQDATKPIIYEIVGIGDGSSSQLLTWVAKSDRLITVQSYYKERYGIELK